MIAELTVHKLVTVMVRRVTRRLESVNVIHLIVADVIRSSVSGHRTPTHIGYNYKCIWEENVEFGGLELISKEIIVK